jgi:DMSO reductase anchor subunit
MTDAEFHHSIRRIRGRHWLHYLTQALLMGCVVLVGGSQTATGSDPQPQLASWPMLLLLGALIPLLGILLYVVARRMQPNLRRPAEQNLRVYQSRVFLRNSLLSLLALPLLVSYIFTRAPLDLAAGGILLLALSILTLPSAKTYQRWLLS